MALASVEAFLQGHIGLNAETIGHPSLRKAVRQRMQAHALEPSQNPDYLALLEGSEAEQAALVDAIVVPETWFFRNHPAFEYLADYALEQWRNRRSQRPLRLLSAPCASGEEAYSMAISLLHAGLDPAQFQVDALDISQQALVLARQASYGPGSFRSQDDTHAYQGYFEADAAQRLRVRETVRQQVRFRQANLVDAQLLRDESPYDVIFCRNVLIYMSKQARTQVLQRLRQLLKAGGLLFLGHAERPLVCSALRFEQVPRSHVFACRKPDADTPPRAAAPACAAPREAAAPPRPPAPAARPAASAPALVPAPAKDSPGASLEHAERLADQGRLSEALALCQAHLRRQPDDVRGNYLSGVIYQALDEVGQAERYFNKTLYLNPRHLEALRHLCLLNEARNPRLAAQLRQRFDKLRQQPPHE